MEIIFGVSEGSSSATMGKRYVHLLSFLSAYSFYLSISTAMCSDILLKRYVCDSQDVLPLLTHYAVQNEWRKFVSPTCPGPRSAHAVVATPAGGGKLYLFGKSPYHVLQIHESSMMCRYQAASFRPYTKTPFTTIVISGALTSRPTLGTE